MIKLIFALTVVAAAGALGWAASRWENRQMEMADGQDEEVD